MSGQVCYGNLSVVVEKQKLLDTMLKQVRQHCQHANALLVASSEYSRMGCQLVWCMGKCTINEQFCEELCVQRRAAASCHASRSSTKPLC